MEVSKVEKPKAAIVPKPQQQAQKKGKSNKAPLDKVAQHSKNIQKRTTKKNRFQKFTTVKFTALEIIFSLGNARYNAYKRIWFLTFRTSSRSQDQPGPVSEH